MPLPDTVRVTAETKGRDHARALVMATPSAMGGPWMRRFASASTAFASGWMALRGVRRRRAADRGFVMSDHADWTGSTRRSTPRGRSGCVVTHGYTSIFARWLRERGLDAAPVETEWEGESLDDPAPEEAAAAAVSGRAPGGHAGRARAPGAAGP